MEILIVFIIAAVLAAIAIPVYSKTVQKNEKRRAETYLRAIRLAQKMYYVKNGSYACVTSCDDASAIKTALGAEVADGKYIFSVASADGSAFTATAEGYTKKLNLDQDGTWSGDDTPLPSA